MKQIQVQLMNSNDEIVEEKQIVVREGDTLIMQFPKTMRVDEAHSVYKTLTHSLENPTTDIIGIPEEISFKVINVRDVF